MTSEPVLLGIILTVLWVQATAIQDNVCTTRRTNLDVTARFIHLSFDELRQPDLPDGHDTTKCVWNLQAVQSTHRVKIMIKTLSLSNTKDRVYIYDGKNATDDRLVGDYGPCAKGSLTLYSTGPAMTIVLVSHSNARRGKMRLLFKALPEDWIECDARDKSAMCSDSDAFVQKPFGHVSSPGFPSSQSSNQVCHWTFNAPENYRIQVTFHWLGMYKAGYPNAPAWQRCDLGGMIRLSNSVVSEEHCGCDELPTMVSLNTQLWLKLLTSPEKHWSGFMLTYRMLSLEDCPANVSDCSAFSHEPHGFNNIGQICSDREKLLTTQRPTTTSATTITSATIKKLDNPGEEITEAIDHEKEKPQKTQPEDDKNSPDTGFTVKCSNDHMLVSVSLERFENLEPSSLGLEDVKCVAQFVNETLAIFRLPLDGCGTTHNSTDQHITYWNTLTGESLETGNHLITRKYKIRLGFDCTYAKRAAASVSFSPRKKAVVSTTDGRGNFTFMMDLYESDEYKEAFDEYPVSIAPGQRLHLQVLVKSSSDVAIFTDTCTATPTADPNDDVRYTFIEHGCSRDSSLLYTYNKRAKVQQFSLETFRFVNTSHRDVFVHCLVQVCARDDNHTVCAKGCEQNTSDSRRRRALTHDEQLDQVLTIGPLQVTSGSYDISPNERLPRELLIGVVTAVLGVLVVVLVTAIVVMLVKKSHRKKAKICYYVEQDSNDFH